jgi:hypothetical protein
MLPVSISKVMGSAQRTPSGQGEERGSGDEGTDT